MSPRDWRTSWCDTEFTSKLPDWDPTVPVHRVEATAGDCVLFTVRCRHHCSYGSGPWPVAVRSSPQPVAVPPAAVGVFATEAAAIYL